MDWLVGRWLSGLVSGKVVKWIGSWDRLVGRRISEKTVKWIG